MDVGMMMVFASYGWENIGDDRVWDEEIRLARLAADSGFDVLWSAEHHFFDYSFCPDNLQLMTYLAALCPNVGLGTAAVIVPWHDPLRVAEQAAVLDLLCKGKLRLGLGRGLARREFAAFRGTMDESRERFDEAAPMIVEALRTGFIEGDGRHYKQPRIELRPRPQYDFTGRIYAVASSEDSVEAAARLGAHMVMFSDRPWPMRLPAIERNRELHRKFHGRAGAGDDDHRFLHLRPRSGGNRGARAQVHGQICREQLSPLRIPRRAFRHRQGLRRLCAEGGDRAPGRARRRGRRVHAGGDLGHPRPHPARVGSAARRDRRFRAQRGVPLRRRAL